jgi:hypothetical protein
VHDSSPEYFKEKFRMERGFNELFELFRQALDQGIDSLDLYRELLWNNSLSSEELFFFAKRLGEVFPHLAFEIYMWLSKVFESRPADIDSLELAFLCLKKAAEFDPKSDGPYVNSCSLYNSDLNIPTLQSIMSFLKSGMEKVGDPTSIYERLSVFYKMIGNDEMFRFYKQKSGR